MLCYLRVCGLCCLVVLMTVAAEQALPQLKTWHVDEGKDSHRFMIEAAGEFRLGFVRSMNYGLSEWYDLHADPEAKSNLTRRDLGDNANGFQGALFNQVLNPHDVIAHIALAGTRFKDEPRWFQVIEATPARVIVEVSYYCMLSSTVSKEFKLTTRYAIYPSGRIYIKNTLLFEQDYTLTTWRHATISLGDPQHYGYGTKEKGEAVLIDKQSIRNDQAKWKPGSLKGMQLEQPKWNTYLIADNTENTITIERQISGQDALKSGPYTIGSSETIYGWLRGNDLTNPHAWSSKTPTFIFVYWDKNTPAPLNDYARASLMLAEAADNEIKGGASMHSWVGFKRYYLGGDFKITRKQGERIVQHYVMQLGAEGSSILPDIRGQESVASYAHSYQNPIPGQVFDRANGVYRLQLKEKQSLQIVGEHPLPVVECDKQPRIVLNGKALSAGRDYGLHQHEDMYLVQFYADWQDGDVVTFD